ncbi:hypothetical protein [Sphingobium tyrosinilyticum]|uniref:Tyr recombinase domain-containing protein n=1 Tax=Sphingobium tyrosinilyticum TaxID=2715436 RepID=A0ABV9F0W3_9SPHN
MLLYKTGLRVGEAMGLRHRRQEQQRYSELSGATDLVSNPGNC